LTLQPLAAGIAFPPGAGGLPTMRLVCEFVADLPPTATAGTSLTYADNSFAQRIGWREIVVNGDLLGVSDRLTSYPQGLLTQPLDIQSVTAPLASIQASVAGWQAPDAQPLTGSPGDAGETGASAAVPGGVGGELSALIDAKDLSPAVVLISLL